jgi:hypothetical protein
MDEIDRDDIEFYFRVIDFTNIVRRAYLKGSSKLMNRDEFHPSHFASVFAGNNEREGQIYKHRRKINAALDVLGSSVLDIVSDTIAEFQSKLDSLVNECIDYEQTYGTETQRISSDRIALKNAADSIIAKHIVLVSESRLIDKLFRSQRGLENISLSNARDTIRKRLEFYVANPDFKASSNSRYSQFERAEGDDIMVEAPRTGRSSVRLVD